MKKRVITRGEWTAEEVQAYAAGHLSVDMMTDTAQRCLDLAKEKADQSYGVNRDLIKYCVEVVLHRKFRSSQCLT